MKFECESCGWKGQIIPGNSFHNCPSCGGLEDMESKFLQAVNGISLLALEDAAKEIQNMEASKNSQYSNVQLMEAFPAMGRITDIVLDILRREA